MMPIIKQITAIPVLQKPKRVAAYTRVSSGKDAMLHSLSAQVSYYNNLIQNHEGWQFAGVYSDEALTGTKESRDEFQRMLQDCRAGFIDIVITKSISRFARNTVTLLQVTRELKSLGVDVFFEEQNIHTMSTEGELMLTILASYAQEESLSASENQKWRIQKNFEKGMPWNGTIFGYRLSNGVFTVVTDEAEIIKGVFADYLSGMGTNAIMKKLNALGIKTRFGGLWQEKSVMSILRNHTYTGNLFLQKTFRDNNLSKTKCPNNGELQKYYVENAHEPIISEEIYNAVQDEITRRAERYAPKKRKTTYPFSGLINCAKCGKHYRRRITETGVVWICSTKNTYGKAACDSKQIPEKTIIEVTLDAVKADSLDDLHNKVLSICAEDNNTLVYTLADGETVTKQWKDRSRSESWTPEMKQAAREKAERGKTNAKSNNHSGNKKQIYRFTE